MAEQQNEQCIGNDDVDNPNYRPPAQKSISEIQNLDAEDESLRKYKEALLGKVDDAVPVPDDPRNVIVKKLCFCSVGRKEIEIDLTGNLEEVAKQKFIVKEGTQYRLKVYFYVQREIVAGLRFTQKVSRKGLKVEVNKMMVGSYGPKKELQKFETALEDLPAGLINRGTYVSDNKFTDDDKNTYLEWKFKIEIKKDWEN